MANYGIIIVINLGHHIKNCNYLTNILIQIKKINNIFEASSRKVRI